MTDLLSLPSAIAERGLLIGGDRVTKSSGGTAPNYNPSTGEIQSEVPLAGRAEIDQAVQAAREASRAWGATPGPLRASIMHRFAGLIEQNAVEFESLARLETGANFPIASNIAPMTAAWARYFAGWTDKIEGAVIPAGPGTFNYVLREPYGVIAALMPWNAPAATFAFKAIPALAAGNAVVVKPPELAPHCVLRIGELAVEAGFPAGVVNIVPGGPDAGDALVRHHWVDKISFTGGGATARKVASAAGESLKPVIMELGGKSANVVFADADLDVAVAMASMAFTVMSGQACALPTRLLVQREAYGEVCGRLTQVARSLRVGDPVDLRVDLGPVITESALKRILGVIQRARTAREGELAAGGERLGGDLSRGYFLQPTLFIDANPDSALVREEIFGPVLAVMPFDTEEEAVALANDNVYGLGGYVHTSDLRRAHRVAQQLDAGYIGINSFGPHTPATPFGGNKASGWGREGGSAGLNEFLKLKNIYAPL